MLLDILIKGQNIIVIKKRGYRDLIGKSIFDCHQNPKSEEMIKSIVEERFELNLQK